MYIIIIIMAQQPYMGSGLLLPPLFEVTGSCAFVAVGDWPTGRAAVLSILERPDTWR
jgi:membrane protein CcdC involved in cytochrome C biogenesis